MSHARQHKINPSSLGSFGSFIDGDSAGGGGAGAGESQNLV